VDIGCPATSCRYLQWKEAADMMDFEHHNESNVTFKLYFNSDFFYRIVSVDDAVVIFKSAMECWPLSVAHEDCCRFFFLYTRHWDDKIYVPEYVVRKQADAIRERHEREKFRPSDEAFLDFASSPRGERISGRNLVGQLWEHWRKANSGAGQ
jgi:hypothetical protein